MGSGKKLAAKHALNSLKSESLDYYAKNSREKV